jgi:hypothetical protein
MRDAKSGSKAELSINSLLLTAAVEGDQGVDLDGCQGALCVVSAGTIATGTTPLYTFGIRECDTLGGSYTVVAAGELVGSAITFGPGDDDTVKSIAYIGGKQFVRIDLETVTGTAGTGGLFTGLVIKSRPKYQPVA